MNGYKCLACCAGFLLIGVATYVTKSANALWGLILVGIILEEL